MSKLLAHVSYVVPENVRHEATGADIQFLTEPLSHPANIVILMASILAVVAFHLAESKVPRLNAMVKYFRGRGRTYQEFLPLILRSAVGITLIGAGVSNHLITPAVQGNDILNFIQVVLGFLLVTGFLITPAAFFTLAFSIFAMMVHPTLIESLEVPATMLALIIIGQSKPGFDDLLGLPMMDFPEKLKKYTSPVLRLGLGLSMIIMAIHDKFLNPHLFGYVAENSLTPLLGLSPQMLTLSAGLTEFAVGLAILVGCHTRFASAIGFLILSFTFFVFQEEVFAHVTLFAVLAVLIIQGAGPLSIDSWYAERKRQNLA